MLPADKPRSRRTCDPSGATSSCRVGKSFSVNKAFCWVCAMSCLLAPKANIEHPELPGRADTRRPGAGEMTVDPDGEPGPGRIPTAAVVGAAWRWRYIVPTLALDPLIDWGGLMVFVGLNLG
jgi:hypothetical protein